jgi:GntR family transcriptional repressor for pyruvate dehydrogenase complex
MNDKSVKAYEKVVDYIQHEIWMGNLKIGERLPPERELADLLGVSRNSVREALRTLSLMGFVSSVQGAGNFITCDFEKNFSESLRMMLMMGETNYLQISQLRRALDGETARLAAGRILPKQAARMKELVQKMREESDVETGAGYDQEFHSLLCEAAGNRLIKSFFGALYVTVNEFIRTMYARIAADDVQEEALMESHAQLAAALCRHDQDAAVRAVQAHYEIVDASILQEVR